MDVSDEMKDFDWKQHWAYKEHCESYFTESNAIIDRLDAMMVDFWEVETARHEGRPAQHPQYRIMADEEWYEKTTIPALLEQGRKREEIFVPWEDPEYAYLFPHREDRAKGPGVAVGPPEGYTRARKQGEPNPRFLDEEGKMLG
ncbi:MAG: hypothetical protein LQ340_008131, partial [Diploschistes diacapsis]